MSYNYNHDFRRNSILEPSQLVAADDIFHTSATQKYMLGCKLDFNNGWRFRYQKAGSVALTAALCNQSAVGVAGWQNEVQTNGSIWAIGDKVITAVLTTTATEDQFADGYLTIEHGTGNGQMYLIKSNKAGTANATAGYNVQITLADVGGIRIATATTSEVTVTLNKYSGTIIFPTDPTGVATGVNLVAVAANYYFWGQTIGACPVVTGSDTIVVGDACGVGTATAGAACLMDIAADGDVLMGYVLRAGAATELSLIDLMLE